MAEKRKSKMFDRADENAGKKVILAEDMEDSDLVSETKANGNASDVEEWFEDYHEKQRIDRFEAMTNGKYYDFGL